MYRKIYCGIEQLQISKMDAFFELTVALLR